MTLSDKIWLQKDDDLKMVVPCLDMVDVKEFIKKVVEIVEMDYVKALKVKAIKQLAGDELV